MSKKKIEEFIIVLVCIFLMSIVLNIGFIFKAIIVDCNCNRCIETYNNKD